MRKVAIVTFRALTLLIVVARLRRCVVRRCRNHILHLLFHFWRQTLLDLFKFRRQPAGWLSELAFVCLIVAKITAVTKLAGA